MLRSLGLQLLPGSSVLLSRKKRRKEKKKKDQHKNRETLVYFPMLSRAWDLKTK